MIVHKLYDVKKLLAAAEVRSAEIARARQIYSYYGLQAAALYLQNNQWSLEAAMHLLVTGAASKAIPDTVLVIHCRAVEPAIGWENLQAAIDVIVPFGWDAV